MRYWPLGAGRTVTSGFGPRWGTFHWGTDFGRPGGSAGMPVYAAQAGTVIHAGAASGFGRWVVIDHPTESGSGTTVYGHVVPEVRVGQAVTAGQRIAHINPDRRTNGDVDPHLHFEVHRLVWAPPGPDRLDPMPWLAGAAEPETPAPGGTAMGNQLQADVTILSPNDSGPRDPRRCRLAIIHTNEGPASGSVDGLLGYLAKPTSQASYTIVVGGDGRIGRSNDDNYVPWAAGSPANELGLHLCFLGYARQTREEWLSRPAQLAAGARVLRDWHARYGIPLRKITGAQMRAGLAGVGGHNDTVDAWHATDHTDPGPAFPWDVLLDMTNRTEEDDMTPEQAKQLADIHREVTQWYPSRSKYADDPKKPIDTLAGFVLNADARVHEASIDVPAKLDRLQQSIDELPDRIAAAIRDAR
ncbi:peptidoglycan DD-metalloendopeptidase family protein [Nocardia cyriacigeorgica]|uniref:N-acetylmuramoyl-L-alanine amidase n=1 Tax=Nocardia cyriacigeorgica TaxID=135487 RepID=A0A5R8NHJ5_9NOCA|nr:peptidoglycan DD-metalloendopeptidase family protein [Nocardia cyriacigeorgica]TLF74057.1 N-acetylmuramoyl-L-alanine amidase [Nocardia cyriacigeorgica]